MSKFHFKPLALVTAVLGMAFSASVFAAGANQCAACHANVAKDHAGAVHAKVECAACHKGTEEHLKDMKKRPETNMDPANCGACHQEQYKSLYTMSDRGARLSK